MKGTILKIFLIISGLFQIAYWGISHLFFPQWYLKSVGLVALAANPGTTIAFMNEIGTLTIGMGVATILAAINPVKNFVVIIMLYMVAAGSIAVSMSHIASGTMASGEWTTVVVIAVQLLLLSILYPWSELKPRQ